MHEDPSKEDGEHKPVGQGRDITTEELGLGTGEGGQRDRGQGIGVGKLKLTGSGVAGEAIETWTVSPKGEHYDNLSGHPITSSGKFHSPSVHRQS